MARIDVQTLSITFPLRHADTLGLRQRPPTEGRLTSSLHGSLGVHALHDISFTVQAGERLGLIGGNGAGKTTLLRALAGVYEPTDGRVRVTGKIGALLDQTLGMNMELTGRENIRLRAMIAGVPARQRTEMEQDVESFADLGTFMDLPVQTYSSGMVVRLAFGLATAIQPHVLLMDEWFMAGDATFRHRARNRLENLVHGADILVLSSHMADIMATWCTRLIWLEEGRIRMDGPTQQVLHAYLPRPAPGAEHG